MALQIDDIIEFVEKQTGIKDVNEGSDIFKDLACTGDDFHELIELYAKQFNVDLGSYIWYFHADEEGISLGGLFFKPPYQKVTQIPVTPHMLFKFAQDGRWGVIYPSHEIQKIRYDILINGILVLGFIGYLIYRYIIK
jgi:Protein of unknown function (DUF1493)